MELEVQLDLTTQGIVRDPASLSVRDFARLISCTQLARVDMLQGIQPR